MDKFIHHLGPGECLGDAVPFQGEGESAAIGLSLAWKARPEHQIGPPAFCHPTRSSRHRLSGGLESCNVNRSHPITPFPFTENTPMLTQPVPERVVPRSRQLRELARRQPAAPKLRNKHGSTFTRRANPPPFIPLQHQQSLVHKRGIPSHPIHHIPPLTHVTTHDAYLFSTVAARTAALGSVAGIEKLHPADSGEARQMPLGL